MEYTEDWITGKSYFSREAISETESILKEKENQPINKMSLR